MCHHCLHVSTTAVWIARARRPTKVARKEVWKEVVVDVCAAGQSWRSRVPKKAMYLPLDNRVAVYSAMHQDWVQNVYFDVRTDGLERIEELLAEKEEA